MKTLPDANTIVDGHAWMIPVPVTYSPIRFTQSYVVMAGEGLTVIDPGPAAHDTYDALRAGLEDFGLALADIRQILVTHYHFDHYGLAPRLRSETGATIALGEPDARIIAKRVNGIPDDGDDWLAQCGVPPDQLDAISRNWMGRARHGQELPDLALSGEGRVLVPGSPIVAVATPGHTPGHRCFLDVEHGLLFTGDHILPRITPNIAFNPDSGDDPLGDYLDSLDLTARLGPVTALPAHIGPIADLGERIDEIQRHHRTRLDEHLSVLAAGAKTVWEVASKLTWSGPWSGMDDNRRRQALGETHAHLVYLGREGEVQNDAATPIGWSLAE